MSAMSNLLPSGTMALLLAATAAVLLLLPTVTESLMIAHPLIIQSRHTRPALVVAAAERRGVVASLTTTSPSSLSLSLLLLSSSALSESSAGNYKFALLFDCDGVILETEELHRLAYNEAFRKFDLTMAHNGEPVEWSVEYYDILQNTVGGGKPKMYWHFRNTAKAFPKFGSHPPPATAEEQEALIDAVQTYKTNRYKELLENEAQARPGVLELLDEALADPTIAVGVCSAATKAAAVKTLDITLGPERVAQLDVCILGDDVSAKKPDPMIYNVARERLGMPAERCVVIEDSMVGLRAAKAANMKCLITYTASTASADFYGEGADAAVPDLASRGVTLESIFAPLREKGLNTEILVGMKDPATTVSA